MQVSFKKLFRIANHSQPHEVTAALPIDIKDPPRRKPRRREIPDALWIPKPANCMGDACLRVAIAGKLGRRVRRALRTIDGPRENLQAMVASRQVQPGVRNQLKPVDRVLLALYVGGESGLRARRAEIAAQVHPAPLDSNEQQILNHVLAPYQALRAIFELEDVTCDATDTPNETLARAVLEALCDDPAGVRTPAVALVACDMRLENGGLFKARQRVRLAQIEMLTANSPSEPQNITQALDIALQQLARAGFPDVLQ